MTTENTKPFHSRSLSRRIALQVLFKFEDHPPQMWLNQPPAVIQTALDGELRIHFKHFDLEPGLRTFTQKVLLELIGHWGQVNDLISELAKNWQLSRMPLVDRSLLRLGVTELLFMPEVPKKVVINEYIELGREFGSAESPSFINGVLDQVSLDETPPTPKS